MILPAIARFTAPLFCLLLLAAVWSGCEEKKAPEVVDDSLLVLGRAYPDQRVAPGGTASYRFRTTRRGPYLIIVSDVAAPTEVTLTHPKRVCYLLGNGSCELISSPDETYEFEIVEGSAKPLVFTLRVIPTDGLGLYEGATTDPLPIAVGQTHQGSVGVKESSYYRFNTGAGKKYNISVSGVHSDLSWMLFDRWFFDVILLNCDNHAGAADESCPITARWPHTQYFIKVVERSGVPGGFSLAVTPR
jgi:hypothetical protein